MCKEPLSSFNDACLQVLQLRSEILVYVVPFCAESFWECREGSVIFGYNLMLVAEQQMPPVIIKREPGWKK